MLSGKDFEPLKGISALSHRIVMFTKNGKVVAWSEGIGESICHKCHVFAIL